MIEIITNFLYQIVFTVGVIVAFGLLIALCRRTFCNIIGYNGSKILLITGIVGTPIHELSHALMCVIFGHKIQEIKLYQPDSNDGTLGYVNHSFNPKNLYHQIGNFFIGVAPIICGSGVLLLLMRLLVPNIFNEVQLELQAIKHLESFEIIKFSSLFLNIITSIFSIANMDNIVWWIFIILSLMISSHMELSVADIKGGVKGFLYIAGILLIVDIIIALFSISALTAVTGMMISFALSIASFLAISGVFSGIMLLVALAIKGIKRGR